jgi:hypothetical protein
MTRQGNEDKIRYFYIKGGTSWSSCNYGISGKCRQQITIYHIQILKAKHV